MFRLLGRILLAIAAGLLIYNGINGIINGLNAINAVGGWGAVTAEGYWNNVAIFGVGIADIVLALPALFGFIRGKCGFWMFIFAALLGAGVGYQAYLTFQKGGFPDALSVWNFILSLLMPVCYALGTIFILLRRRGGSKE